MLCEKTETGPARITARNVEDYAPGVAVLIISLACRMVIKNCNGTMCLSPLQSFKDQLELRESCSHARCGESRSRAA